MKKPVSLGEAFATAVTNRHLTVKLSSSGKTVKVPLRAIHDDSEVYQLGDLGNLIVMRWWAEDEELVESSTARLDDDE